MKFVVNTVNTSFAHSNMIYVMYKNISEILIFLSMCKTRKYLGIYINSYIKMWTFGTL